MLDAALLQYFDADGPVAHGLPGEAYTSDAFMQLEREQLFANHWVFVGFAHKLVRVGDVQPIQVGGLPLFLLRDQQRRITAFHNVCRHRNLQLVDAAGNCGKLLRCPYHSWSYDLCGALKNAPYFGGQKAQRQEGFDYAENGLAVVNCEVWHDWIFVNLAPQPMSFADFLAPILRQLGANDVTDYIPLATIDLGEVPCNWKLLMENFIEPYHVFSCHPWLNEFVGMNEREAPVFEDKVLSCGYRFQKADPARGGQLPWFPNLPADKRDRGDWFVLFPNFGFEIFPDQVDVFIAWPEGPQRCRETIALYFVGDGASAAQFAEARAHVIKNWNDLNQEDIGVVERMQAGRRSDGFDGGVLSPYWDPVLQHFARLVCADIARDHQGES